MERENGGVRTSERPIEKPNFPLPARFGPSGAPLKKQVQRAYFYKKRETETGTPVYDFFITTEPELKKDPGSNS